MTAPAALSEQKRLLLQRHLSGSGWQSPADAIAPREPGARVPISAEQQDVWLHAQMAPGIPLYNEAVTFHRRGSFDGHALQQSLEQIVQRHEIWRTSFHAVDGELRQIVHPELPIEIPFVDVSEVPAAAREQMALDIATADARLPFDLSRPPLLRAKIVRVAPDDHRLYLTLHHIIFDGVSIYRIILPELAALYAGYACGGAPDLAAPALQYGDYALWRERQLARDPMRREIAYWRQQLGGELPLLRLPGDRPHPTQPTHRGGMETFELSRELTDAVKALSRNEGVTLYVILLAAFKAMLHRYTGQEDLVVGGVTDMRRRPELAGVVGYFLNSLALRTRPTGAMPFRDYLREVESTVLGALDASSIPFDRVVREVQPRREGGSIPSSRSCSPSNHPRRRSMKAGI